MAETHVVPTSVEYTPATDDTRALIVLETREGVTVNLYLTSQVEWQLRQELHRKG